MAGIYIHIPFCRQKCNYCDFYKTVNTNHTESFISALIEETKIRQNYLDNETIETIYFGGGTPSVLSKIQLSEILINIYELFSVSKNAEVTLEANPDDLTQQYLSDLFELGINRLSIGIQSFDNYLLKKMNRRHNAKQAQECIENSQKAGFSNVSTDLIYGLPGLTRKLWKNNLIKMFSLPVQHVSAYHLTYHEGTPFYTWLKKGSLKEIAEKESVKQFELLMEEAQNVNFEMYEISNFAKEKYYSKHNTSYWFGKKYLGLGPSAHSFNTTSRQWNISSVDAYIKGIKQNKQVFEKEDLTENQKYNEFILTRIRTKWGIDLKILESGFGETKKHQFVKSIQKHIQAENGFFDDSVFRLSKKGYFVSDDVIADLMII